MAKTLKDFLESYDFNRAAIAKQRLANVRGSGRKVRGARIANLMRAAGLREEEVTDDIILLINEVLSKDATASDWIHDFVHSTNPKFEGKSKKQRIKMALGAYYAKQRNEEFDYDEEALEEGLRSKLASMAIAGALAAGAAGHAHARVSMQDDGTMSPSFAQQMHKQQASTAGSNAGSSEVKKDKTDGPGYSKEYLQKVSSGEHPRPMISKEKADELLKKHYSEEVESIAEKSEQARKNKTMKNMMDASKGAQYNRNSGLKLTPGDTGHTTAQQMNKALGRHLRREESEIDEGVYSHDVERAFPNGKASGVKTHPVAPVPDRKYIKGTPEHKAAKETSKSRTGHPTNMKEEVGLDEGLDPSEIAGNPKMYNADTAKKAYYHKNASESDKQSLAKHLDRYHGNKEWRKPVKEEQQIDEISRDTLLSYANKVSLDSQKHSKDPTKRSAEKANRSVAGYAKAHNRLEKPVKEETMTIDELTSSEISKIHGDAAAHHASSLAKPMASAAKPSLLSRLKSKVKDVADRTNPDKFKKYYGETKELIGKQKKLDKNHNGKLDSQDFKILRKEEKEDVPFEGPYKKAKDTVTDKSGAKHTPMSRARHLARMALQKKKQEVKEAAQYKGLEKEPKKGLPTAVVKTSRTAVKSDTVEGWDHPADAVKKEHVSYSDFINLIEGKSQYMVKLSHKDKGHTMYKTYTAEKGEDDYDIKRRAQVDHSRHGYNVDSVRKKDMDTYEADDEDNNTSSTPQKRGRGRPAGSKSGARKITGTSKLYK